MIESPKLSCLALFAGAGGLAKGLEMAGFQHKAFVELNKDACLTLARNYDSRIIQNVDIRTFDFSRFGHIDIVSGGPPCQPFSMGGKHRGNMDNRDMFPYACKAISACTPKAFVFENVKGLLRKSFGEYFEYILLRLKYPGLSLKTSERWEEHLTRLNEVDASGGYRGVKYKVIFRLLDAANYGIPQRRERVFIVGIREDLRINWSFPKESHSLDSLLWSQFVTGDYWRKNEVEPLETSCLDQRMKQRVEQFVQQPRLFPPSLEPWRTVRDQIGKLPEPDIKGSFNDEHILREGARSYPGHTGSYIDMPSKTLKAGDHGVPGGENMIRYRDGRIRYYTIFEAKRIQTFPDSYEISGSWTEAMRQIGNAVPVELGCRIAGSLAQAMYAGSPSAETSLI
jgi:DNA (cytosine-5)-methyltransferase 1